jgi:hypothetical protein
MNFNSLTLTRRTFLGVAGTAVAATAAHTVVGSLLTPRPLQVAAFIDGRDGLDGLDKLLEAATFDLRATIASSANFANHVNTLLTDKGSQATALSLPLRRNEIGQLPDAVLIFGRWDTEGQSLPLLSDRKAIYVDDPFLALRLGQARATFQYAERSLVGMTSLLDPLVEHAEQRVRSGVMGKLQGLSISARRNAPIDRLEGTAILRRFSPNHFGANVREIFTRNLYPGVLITCAHGQLQLPFCSTEERFSTLPLRLHHFLLVAQAKARSAMTLPEIRDLALRMEFQLGTQNTKIG